MKVLVASCSRHGATTEIAEAIARTLADRGLDVAQRPIETAPRPADYDAIVLGSAVYMGSWLDSATWFLEAHGSVLATKPTWLFSSGPIGDPQRPPPDDSVDLEDVLERLRLREHRVFAGRLDHRRLSFDERAVVLALGARDGDYRDWDAIGAWAEEIALTSDVSEVAAAGAASSH